MIMMKKNNHSCSFVTVMLMQRWCWVARDDLVWRRRLEKTFHVQVGAHRLIIIIYLFFVKYYILLDQV